MIVSPVFAGKRYLRDNPIEAADPAMNKRGTRMVGQTAVVTQAIEGGSGRVHYGDSEWIARGPDSPIGSRVRIAGSDEIEPEFGVILAQDRGDGLPEVRIGPDRGDDADPGPGLPIGQRRGPRRAGDGRAERPAGDAVGGLWRE